MTEIFALAGDFISFLFVDMDGAEVVYDTGAIPTLIENIIAVPLLAIGLAVSMTGLAIGMVKKFRKTV